MANQEGNVPTASATGYGPSTNSGPQSRWNRLFFNGDEQGFEMWETKFLGYMRLKQLKDTIDPAPATNGGTVAEPDNNKNADAYAELIQLGKIVFYHQNLILSPILDEVN